MKKAYLFTLLSVLLILSLLLLTGCNKEDRITSVTMKDHDPGSVIEIALGEFDYSSYSLLATYESGNTEDITLSTGMIAETDLVKFYQEGEHDITVTYGGKQCTFKISVKRSTFKDLKFPENAVFTYDGKPHVVEVEGNIPANAVITYVGGNSFVNVGTYDVTAIVSCDGYVTEKLATTVKIERAKYDMSGVKFEAKEFVYDGQSHSVSISGTLPEGVSLPTYFISERQTSSAVDVGEYKVTAVFANNDPNYETIPDMQTTLTILPAVYTVKGVDIIFRKDDGKLLDGANKIYDGKSVTFDLNDYSKLSKKISVSFSVCDAQGKEISTSNKITNIKDVGLYTVKVMFTLADGKNYQPIEPLVTTFEVLNAEYPSLDDIRLVSTQITYDGAEHSLAIDGQLPEGVTVFYEYYIGDKLIVDGDGKPVQSVKNTGVYTVKAIFEHNDVNHGKIPDISATLNIKKFEVPLSAIGFTGENSIEYSGNPYEPKFKTWKDTFGIDYDIFYYSDVKYYVYDSSSGKYIEMSQNEYPTDVGLYRVSVDISIAQEYIDNYVLAGTADVQTIVKQFEIVKKQLEIPEVTFTNSSSKWEYTGSVQGINHNCEFDSTLMTVSIHYYKYVAGEYIALQSGEIPTDAGSYRFVVTVALKDTMRYVFENSTTSDSASFDFEISPLVINVGGVALKDLTFTYDNKDYLQGLVVGIPTHVNATVKLYSSSGTTPLLEAINAGKYRVEIVLAPANSNYALSSNEKFVFNFEILKKRIHVGEMSFDADEFVYNGSAQYPTLVDIPEHVKTGMTFTAFYGYAGEFLTVGESVDAGKYSIEVRLAPESLNYVLFDGTNELTIKSYSTEYTIVGEQIDLDTQLSNGVKLDLPEQGYTAATLKSALEEALFGDMSGHVECSISDIYVYVDGKAEKVSAISGTGSYSAICYVSVDGLKDQYQIDRYNYVVLHNGQRKIAFGIEIYFDIEQ